MAAKMGRSRAFGPAARALADPRRYPPPPVSQVKRTTGGACPPLLFLPQVPVKVVPEHPHPDNHDRQIELVPVMREHLDVLPELDPSPGEEITPDKRADEGEEAKDGKVRLEHPGRKRDEGAHNRQHAADQECDVAILVDPAVRRLQLFRLEQKIAPVSLQERAAAVKTEDVRGNRTQYAADGSGQSCQMEVHLALLHQDAGG